MLVRDRKPIITNLANFIGNILFLIILSLFAYNVITEQYRLPPLVDDTPLSIALVSACLFFLFLRIFMRIMVVYITYGWYQSLLAVPRLFWANVINFIATNRAIFIYTKTKITGQKATWDKTAHVYPSEDELRAYRRKLGDLLLDRRFLTIEQLDNALAAQKKSNKRLGEILIEQGLITEDQLIQALGVQFTVATQEIDPYHTPMQVLELVPVSLAYKYSVYPLSLKNGQLTVASNEMLDEKALHALEKTINHSITLRLATKSDISFAIRKGYARQNDLEDASLLGKKLVEANEITLEQLQSALKEQRSRYTSLGDILLLQNAITKEQLVEADKEYLEQEQSKKIGEFLVDKGYIRSEQLNAALEEQKKRSPMLGEVLLEQGAVQQENLKRFLSV
jgi:adsorption protein B